jgi:AcrR family transcriptional regulator
VARVRTDEKRSEIVRIASEVFEEVGFERATMATISERVGGSKATLYGYFPSKDDLLKAVISHEVVTSADRMIREFPADPDDLRSSLIKLCTAYLEKRTSALPITNIRMVANQPADSTMGTEFYLHAIKPAFDRLAKCFEQLMDEGRLRRADPKLVTMHWKGLCDWDFFERRLLGVIKGPDPKEIREATEAAADAFLTLYGTAMPDRKRRPSKRKQSRRRPDAVSSGR